MVPVYALIALSNTSGGTWTLKDGAAVSFIFETLTGGLTAWRPNGAEVDASKLPKSNIPNKNLTDTRLVALIRPGKATSVKPDVRFKFPGQNQMPAAYTFAVSGGKIWEAVISPPPGFPAKQDVAVGIADGQWTEAGYVSYGIVGGQWQSIKRQGIADAPEVTGNGKTISVKMSLTAKQKSGDVRLVAQDPKGVEIPLIGISHEVYTYEGDIKNLGWLQLQTRPFEWKTIPAANFTRVQTIDKVNGKGG